MSVADFIKLPARLQGQFDFFGVGIGLYRLFIIVICGLLTVALQLILARTRFGSRLRAAVDDPRVARGLGINVQQCSRSPSRSARASRASAAR